MVALRKGTKGLSSAQQKGSKRISLVRNSGELREYSVLAAVYEDS